ncbi:GumC family protein [Ruegeria faecimaris]|uniref:GumC family protein n=1 Tax=Ruegeria faecimaris TaxID=686389 RepID=UPI0023301E79|nr:Wzz/FepE/Etk N-terminal domain-containing protein [Ruegeria faecimaris]
MDQNHIANQFGQQRLDGIWRMIYRHLKLILGVTAAVIVGTFMVVNQLDPRYKSRAEIVLTSLDMRVRADSVELESYELTRTLIETEIDILRSREFAAEVALALDLFENEAFAGAQNPANPQSTSVIRNRVIDNTLSTYNVLRQGESLAIEIISTAEDPQLAADIANTVAETFILRLQQRRQQGLSSSISFLKDRVNELGDELTRDELQMAAFILEENLADESVPGRLRSELARLNSQKDVHEINGASSEEVNKIADQIAVVEQALRSRTGSEIALLRMERALELLRIRYQTTIEKLNDFETQQQFLGQAVQQVSVAHAPTSAFWPNTKVAVAVSAIVGFSLAFVIALLMEGSNTRIVNENQIEQQTDLTNLGFLPDTVMDSDTDGQQELLRFIRDQGRSPYVEALRSVLTMWFNTNDDGSIVMVTSGVPGEGKTVVAVSLALVAGTDGMRVLLLDMDNHRCRASKTLGLTGAAPVEIEDALSGAVQPSQIYVDGERVPGVSSISLNLRPKISRKQLMQQLGEYGRMLRNQYDLVLVDTPPTLVIDDTIRLGPLVDGTFLVVRWGQTTEKILKDAIEKLRMSNIKISGTIMNGVNMRKQRQYGYGAYTYHYSDEPGKSS